MKRVLSNPLAALSAGLCLRLYFVLKFPAASDDTVLYEQIATNWLKHHAYAVTVGGQMMPVDVRMPGYPAFLAIVYALTRRTGVSARFCVMLVQIAADLASCLVIAGLATTLLLMVNERARPQRVFAAALWLSALCPFTANYTAIPLTEVFAVFFTAAALFSFSMLVDRSGGDSFPIVKENWVLGNDYWYWARLGAVTVGLATLFRPESPMLLVVAWSVLSVVLLHHGEVSRTVRTVVVTGFVCLLPLAPWAIRNAITLHEAQFLAPKNMNLPSELVPYGFMAWERTWLYRVRDCYLVPWKLNDEAILVDDIPARALTIWFTPRIELLPVSGNVFPLRQMREDDPVDQEVSILFFVMNLFYVALGVCGAARLWRANPAARPAVAFLVLFIVLRIAFLTTLETPEPRYVLVCFPALIALGAHVFASYSEGP